MPVTIDPAERIAFLSKSLRDARDPSLDGRNASAWLPALRRWQAGRLEASFKDLSRDPRYARATRFFLDDLYGEGDVSWRDRDVVRILPTMRRWLPAKMLEIVARALELDQLTHRLDLAMVESLATEFGDKARVDVGRYAHAYRSSGTRADRKTQLRLLLAVGSDLDRLARNPVLGTLLKLARAPARAAGLARMQQFLETGFAACKAMGPDGHEFLAIIGEREERALHRLLAGHADPFG